MLRLAINLSFTFAFGIFLSSCFHEQEIPVHVEFDYTIPETFTVPVELVLNNKTTGADFYKWTFEGASPSESQKKDPGTVTYSKAGEYKIILEAWNDTQRSTKEILITLDSAVTLDFNIAILVNDFAPATIQITNYTRGASSYEWTFEGGNPSTSTLAHPSNIIFSTPGQHRITLKVSNGREHYSSTKTITINEALSTEFEIIPIFEDQDYEAPLTATLHNKTISGLHYAWSSNGGVINSPSSENTSISFDTPGDYTVTLNASNDKNTQSVEHTIHVKPNTNIYSMKDVKFGISTTHPSIGCFYSTKLRSILKKDDVTVDNGKLIDLVFYSVNSSFSYCRFVSPDSAFKFTFPAITGAKHTYFINTLETGPISFTSSDFDAMVNDTPLVNLDIKTNEAGTSFFNKNQIPRIILFETEDGCKGAIKILNFVAAGAQSYVMTDIKVQKLKR